MLNSDFHAQGTIEYLVIIAVVVVISLVVVGLMVGQTGNVASISSNSKQVALKVGGIAILDSVAGEDANALIVLQNNSGDALTLEKVEVDGVEHVFGSEPVIGLGGRVSLDLNGVSPCTGSAKKNYSIKVIYLSSSGLEKTFDFGSVTLDCVEVVTSNGIVVSEGSAENEAACASFSYTDFSDCNSSGYQTREVTSSLPASCVGGNPILVQTCEAPYVCTNASPFETGDGSPETPYGICNWTQLNNARDYLSSDFVLLSNLDSSTSDYAGLGDDWQPIIDSENSYSGFSGNFDGNNKTISDLKINLPETDNVGLFGYVVGNISNIGLIDVNVIGYNNAGGLVGYQSSGTIANSYATGNVLGTGTYCFGVLVGYSMEGDISNSYSEGTVSGYVDVGGLAGEFDYGDLTNSYSTADVIDSNGWVGGLVGYADSGTISDSYATGEVIGSENYIGGLIGYSNSTITNSYSMGNVTGGGDDVGGLIGFNTGGSVSGSFAVGTISGNSNVGGLIGENSSATVSNSFALVSVYSSSYNSGGLIGANNDSASIINSYAAGAISSNDSAGGLVGQNANSSSISNSFFTGSVSTPRMAGGLVGINNASVSDSYSTGAVNCNSYAGGLIGYNTGSVSSSYWDTVLSGQSNCYSGGNTGCDSPTSDNEEYYYDSSNVPLSSWTWGEGGWTARDGNYPILSWQTQ